MPKVIQNNNQTLSNSNSNINNNSNNKSSNGSVLYSVFARLVSLLSSFILVLRHGLKKIKEFLGLFPYLRTLFPWRSSTFIKRSRQIRIVAFISCFAFVLLSFTILHPLSSPTQPTEAATGSSQSSSLTLDLASSSASVDLLVTDPEGSFAVSSSNAEFNVTTNNFTGYTLSIMSSNDEGLLTSTNGSSLSSITSAISLDTFAGSTSYNGKWGYRPSVYNAAANTSFLPSPTTTATTLDTTTAPNTTTPNYYTIELGVRSDYTTASSSYTNTFIITAVSNPINYTISYNSHTSDNVTNMPTTQSSSTSATSIVLADNVPTRAHYTFTGWCSTIPTTSSGVDSCSGTNAISFLPGASYGIDQTTLNNTTLYAMWKIDSFTQTTEVRYENADGTWGSYSTVDTKLVNYGDSYSWDTSSISGFNTTQYQSNNVASYTVTADKTNQVSIYRATYRCSAQYKLQNADGTYPSTFTTVTVNSAARYGSTCSYTTTQNSSQYTNQSGSATVNGNTTITVGTNGQVPRRTYSLSVVASTNTSNATGSGTYRYGQTVTVGVTKATNTTCISYAAPTWTKSSGATGSLSSTSGTSITYTMGTTNDTITAKSTASNIAQTITFYTTGGASGITLNGITKTNGQTMSLACGTYNLTGSFNSGYEFSSWSNSGGSIANTGTLSTTYTVNGNGTITLNGKSSVLYMQNFTKSQCQAQASSGNVTVVDSRDNNSYTVRYINGNCWMTQNLRLSGGRTLTSADSNVASSWYFPSTGLTSGNSYTDARYAVDSTYGGYYNYCAASAGTVCSQTKQNATYDICPKGWRLPTQSEFAGITGYSSAFSPVYSGRYNYGSLYSTGSYGYWWSSTAYNSNYQYILGYSSGSLLANDYDYKRIGDSVRCIRSS